MNFRTPAAIRGPVRKVLARPAGKSLRIDSPGARGRPSAALPPRPLDLGPTGQDRPPTDERIAGVRDGDDPQLAALYFQYGRYLLIASRGPAGSRPTCRASGTRASTPPWDSKYTCNINTEMNYWPAERATCPSATSRCSTCWTNGRRRAQHGQDALRLPRLGAAPQLRSLARHGPDQRQRITASGRPAAPGCASTSGGTTSSAATASSSPGGPIRS